MHSVVMESLEEYLAGALNPAAQRAFEAHLNTCQDCRDEVHSMQEVGSMFDSLRAPEVVTASPGFYAKVMRQVGEAKRQPGFSSLFALDFAFGRRLVFASLLAMAILGSYFVSRESTYAGAPTPEFVIAEDDGSSGPDRDTMLVTLATYEP